MISFSSGGWYGIISQEITFENMAIVAQAVSDFLNDGREGKAKVVLGFDTRFLSREYAWEIQRVLTGNEIEVYMMKKPVPTPFVSFAVRQIHADLGVMVTAGGRPARYSGLAFRNSGGFPVSEQWLSELFRFLYRRYPRLSDENRELLHSIDIFDEYLVSLQQYIDFERIKSAKPLVICDGFYGSAGEYFSKIMEFFGIPCMKLRCKPNPGFADALPQPNERNMSLLAKVTKEKKADAGFFFNGDGSRLGVVNSDGVCMDYSLFSAMAVEEWLRREQRGLRAICGFSAPQRAARLMKYYNIPIQSKNGTASWETEGPPALLWDGFSLRYGEFMKDDDAIFQALTLLQGLAGRDLNWASWILEIGSIAGDEYFEQKTLSVSKAFWEEKRKGLFDQSIDSFFDKPLARIEEEQDIKLWFDEEEWIFLNYDGQEEVLSIIATGTGEERTEKMFRNFVAWLYQ